MAQKEKKTSDVCTRCMFYQKCYRGHDPLVIFVMDGRHESKVTACYCPDFNYCGDFPSNF